MDAAVLVIAATDGVMAQTKVGLLGCYVKFQLGASDFGSSNWIEKYNYFYKQGRPSRRRCT